MAVATQIGPTDLLAAPPQVFDAIVRLLAKQDEERRRQEMRGKLRKALGRK